LKYVSLKSLLLVEDPDVLPQGIPPIDLLVFNIEGLTVSRVGWRLFEFL
jgi:hypothetical protein